jgi:hypothetical protein
VSSYRSKPYNIYFDAHTRLNSYIKVSTAAVSHLYNSRSNPKELSELINNLIQTSGERWTPRIIENPQAELHQLNNDLAKTGIIWVYSAFDVYFKQVEGLLSDKFEKLDGVKEKEDEDEEKRELRIVELYNKLNWPVDEIKGLLPVLKFYQILRHCVAHNMGLPSGGLLEQSRSDLFQNSMQSWKTKFPGKKISPPPIITDQAIELRPHHAILYSDTCLRIASDIDKHIFRTFGINHFVNRTIKRHLIDVDILTNPQCLNFARYIAFHLHSDYNIILKPYDKIYEAYRSDELKGEHKKRYHTLKN